MTCFWFVSKLGCAGKCPPRVDSPMESLIALHVGWYCDYHQWASVADPAG